ncbi:MAG: lipid-A-disaccharide synthase [Bdellovibrionaceae bacterium]|nr:lipid-A-disaccharide synthase [Pseudobdellovibrionaceae bacterium]
MIIAAEASSAHYGAKLIKLWKKQERDGGPKIEFFGVGTQEMEDLGFRRIGYAEEMAVVGLVEVIKHFSHLKAVFNRLIKEASKQRPDFVILMDYPDFNLRLAKKLKAMDIKVFYYISPQVWAWRKSRIHDIKAYCEKVFLIFPFEKIFYDHFEVPNDFVGHPLIEDLDESLYNKTLIQGHRQKYGIKNDELVLALMPGSRHGEIERNFPIQLESAKIILRKYKHVRLSICVAPTLTREHLLPYLENFSFPYLMIKDEPNRMICMADLILVASGTATLMVGLLEKPMVIMYKVNWLTGVIGNWLVDIKFFGLINLVLDKETVPERKQGQTDPKHLAMLLEKYITDPKYTQSVINDLKQTKKALGYDEADKKTATQKVIEALNKYLK